MMMVRALAWRVSSACLMGRDEHRHRALLYPQLQPRLSSLILLLRPTQRRSASGRRCLQSRQWLSEHQRCRLGTCRHRSSAQWSWSRLNSSSSRQPLRRRCSRALMPASRRRRAASTLLDVPHRLRQHHMTTVFSGGAHCMLHECTEADASFRERSRMSCSRDRMPGRIEQHHELRPADRGGMQM